MELYFVWSAGAFFFGCICRAGEDRGSSGVDATEQTSCIYSEEGGKGERGRVRGSGGVQSDRGGLHWYEGGGFGEDQGKCFPSHQDTVSQGTRRDQWKLYFLSDKRQRVGGRN